MLARSTVAIGLSCAAFSPAQPPKSALEKLDGQPAVSARSWAILDGKTGKLLWGQDADKPLDPASTTKMMTALVIADVLATEAKALDETLTFSPRADATVGSSADLKAGEKIRVGDLLYGLLLPSGNDAATALAEHFGARTKSGKEAPKEQDPFVSFVVEMNRKAIAMKLDRTKFANPHGLTAPEHKSTARDLGLIAKAVLEAPPFAKIVATPEFSCDVTAVDGAKRRATWKNTNQLLGMRGYLGVKTGTTNAAGCCLAAAAERGHDRLVLVVLGAEGNRARYADARNLFRWAWRERGHKD
jgi:D-alanyl-D-alanine carboxypeptidase (penicillin-binding protein 5/6)